MSLWWYIGALQGAHSLANDMSASATVRKLMAELEMDLLENFACDDYTARRVEK